MKSADLPGLLRRLADEGSLRGIAREAGYASAAEAAEDLRALADQLARTRRRVQARNEAIELSPPPTTSPYDPRERVVVQADGASRGNPGPASYGVVYLAADGTPLCGEGAAIGRATNNVAEYRAAMAALDRLLSWKVRRVLLRLDSQLVVRQILGSYRVKDARLKRLHAELMERSSRFDEFEVEHIPRSENADADALANRALDSGA